MKRVAIKSSAHLLSLFPSLLSSCGWPYIEQIRIQGKKVSGCTSGWITSSRHSWDSRQHQGRLNCWGSISRQWRYTALASSASQHLFLSSSIELISYLIHEIGRSITSEARVGLLVNKSHIGGDQQHCLWLGRFHGVPGSADSHSSCPIAS